MDTPKIQLDPTSVCRRLATFALVLVAINIALQTYRVVMHQESIPGLPMLSLDKENNVPALYSTLLLFAASAILTLVALLERARRGADALKWAILAAGFVLMAVDESLSIHERLIDPLRALIGGALGVDRLGIFYFAWVIPGIALVVALAMYFLPFVRRLPGRFGLMLLVSGAVYLGGAIGVELVEGWWREGHGHRNVVYHALVSLEEGMEMFGVILLIHTLLDYIGTHVGRVEITVLSNQAAAVADPGANGQADIGHVLGRSAVD